MNIIILCGVSGSGKSTWATKFLAAHPDYICINRDALRLALVKTLDGFYKRPDLNKLEGIVNEMAYAVLLKGYRAGYNIVVDNTNLAINYLNEFTNFTSATWQFKLFDIDPTVAKYRVIERDFCGDDTIAMTSDSFLEYTMPFVAYIDKQATQYTNIKNYLLTNHLNNQYAD